MVNCDWIFSSNVDKPFFRTNCACGNKHPLNYCMRIAFQYCPIHKCPRVAFISIAYYIFNIAFRLPAKLPLKPGWEPGAATPPQPGICNLINYIFRFKVKESLCKSLISFSGYILFYIIRIDYSTVSENNLFLLTIKRDVL